MVLGWPKRSKLAHTLLWEFSYKGLKVAQLLRQLGGVFLTCGFSKDRWLWPCSSCPGVPPAEQEEIKEAVVVC
jgi:hypothetical protein